jgi:hypothetical protein
VVWVWRISITGCGRPISAIRIPRRYSRGWVRRWKDLEKVKAALLIGSNVRMEQPLAGHRLRKAALAGGQIMFDQSP